MRSMKALRHDFAAPEDASLASHHKTRRDGEWLFDADLLDLPQAMRWRE